MAPNCLFFPVSHWFPAKTGQLRSTCDPQKKKIAYRWIEFLRSTGAHGWPDGWWDTPRARNGPRGRDGTGLCLAVCLEITLACNPGEINPVLCGASATKCCYAAAGSGTGAEETGLRAPVSRKTSIRDHKGIVVAKKMSRKVSRRMVRPACIAGVRISRPNFRAPCGRTKL